MARDAKVIIMTDERVKDRLQFYADQLGMTMSGLGAYILGYWVYQQDNIVNPLIEEMKGVMSQRVREEFKRMDALEQPSEAEPNVP